MVQQNTRHSSTSRVRKRSKTLLFIAIAVIAILSVGLYYYLQNRPAASPVKSTGSGEVQLSPQKDWPASDRIKEQDGGQPTQGSPSSATEGQLHNQAGNAITSSGLQEENSLLSLDDTKSDSPEHSQKQIDKINAFYTHLDQQLYIQEFALQSPSKEYFSKLLQKLADNPPTVIRETDNLYTLLQNTAHFFRILGKKNISVIKKIMAAESNSFEQNAQAFYQLTAHPEYLKKEYSLNIPSQVITDYAAFFLNTMGGRLYLFRRDSTTRMVITYYAIMALNRAKNAGNENHGIDLRPSILALIEEMENGGKRLQLKDQYLDALYDLQEKFN